MDEPTNDPGYTDVPPPTPPYPPPATPPYPPPVASSGLSENTAAALSYLTIIPAIIFLVMEPYNKSQFVRFHAWQSIALNLVAIALHIALRFIPFIGWMLLGLLSGLLSLAFFIVWLITILKASKGEWYKLPVIGDFALKQAQS
jgi:uncharacterized membrane protein